ncbi:MAG: hypothetical protein Q8M15_09220 [Bacteroidota bacterium]|nr:hypothetical protein [Bacteroidota bacterium]
MIGKLFEKSQTLITSLTEKEVFKKLENHSVGGSLNDQSLKIFFKGKFNLEHHEFRLLQVFDYGPRNQIRPEIIGFTELTGDDLTVNLKIRLPKELDVLLDFAAILNITFLIVLVLVPLPEDIPKRFFFIGLPITMLVFYLMCKLFFNFKTSDCITIIARIINARKTNFDSVHNLI